MKKIIFFMLLSFGSYAYSQIGAMATYDASANASLINQIQESARQTAELQKQFNLLKEAKDRIEQVSGAIQQLGQLQNIINEQRAAISNANKITTIISETRRKTDLSGISYNLSRIQSSITTVQKLLDNGIFKMQDSERMDLINKQYQEVKSSSANITVKLIQLSY